MKKIFTLIIGLSLLSTFVKAQDDDDAGFKTVWESDFENKAKELSVVNFDGSYIFGSDQNEGTMLNGSGTKLWAGHFKDLTNREGVGNADYQFISFEANILFLFNKKMGKDQLSVIDLKLGKGLWTSDQYKDVTQENMEYISELDAFLFCMKSSLVLVNARTGQRIWETDKFRGSIGRYLYLKASNEILMVNYKPTALAALFSGFKNQLVRINAANGNVIWDASFVGFVEKEVVTRKPLVGLSLKDDKVFLQLDGLQVFDFATGASLWRSVYETDEGVRKGFLNRGAHGGKVISGGVYHAIADPIYADDAVYIVLGGDKLKQKFIQKHELQTGKILWTSEKISGAMAMPAMHMEEGRIVGQIGGLVNKQTIERKVETTPNGTETTTYFNNEWIFMGGYGIIALDPATGKTAWRSEKFDKRISNLIFGPGMVYAGSGDEFYGFDLKSGDMKINVDHSKGSVGKTMWAFDNGDNVALVCDKGMAAYSKKDGSNIYKTDKFRGVTGFHMVGDNFFLRKEKESSNTLCGVDLKTGNIKGIVKSKGKGGGGEYGDGFDITDDGEYIFSFRGKGVQKLKVNK
jgi:hypothetical protein